jgi:hypothetical protein
MWRLKNMNAMLNRNRIVLIVIVYSMVLFSQVIFAQTALTPSQVIKLDQEAKDEIDKWMNSVFKEIDGKYYVLIKTKKKEWIDFGGKQFNIRSNIESPFSYELYGNTSKPQYFYSLRNKYEGLIELRNMDGWRIEKENIVKREVDVLNGVQFDEWRGYIYVKYKGSPIFRSFSGCGWSKYSESATIGKILVRKDGWRWIFEPDKSFFYPTRLEEIKWALGDILDYSSYTGKEIEERLFEMIRSGLKNQITDADCSGEVGTFSFENTFDKPVTLRIFVGNVLRNQTEISAKSRKILTDSNGDLLLVGGSWSFQINSTTKCSFIDKRKVELRKSSRTENGVIRVFEYPTDVAEFISSNDKCK